MMFGGGGGHGAAAAVYLSVHFLLYAIVLRHRRYFQTEKGIFRYHLISAMICLLAAGAIVLMHRSGDVFSVACALVAAHGIYSLSFLELWSLAQGSYSLSIMGRGGSGGGLSRAELVDSFARIGDAKKSDRLSGLEASQLIRLDGNHWKLGGCGVIVAAILRSLLWLANIKQRG